MTVKRVVKNLPDYIGLSTDVKPNAPMGELFYETDTGNVYIVDSGSSWALTGALFGELELRGLSTNKPVATAVIPGTTYWSVNTDPHGNNIEVSDGTNWVVI